MLVFVELMGKSYAANSAGGYGSEPPQMWPASSTLKLSIIMPIGMTSPKIRLPSDWRSSVVMVPRIELETYMVLLLGDAAMPLRSGRVETILHGAEVGNEVEQRPMDALVSRRRRVRCLPWNYWVKLDSFASCGDVNTHKSNFITRVVSEVDTLTVGEPHNVVRRYDNFRCMERPHPLQLRAAYLRPEHLDRRVGTRLLRIFVAPSRHEVWTVVHEVHPQIIWVGGGRHDVHAVHTKWRGAGGKIGEL